MVERFLPWLGAGAVTAGMVAAMIAGAGLALADEGPTSGTGGTSSESSNPTGSKEDTSKDAPGDGQPSANDPERGKDDDGNVDSGTQSPSTEPDTEPDEETAEDETAEEQVADDVSQRENSTDPVPTADDTKSESDSGESDQSPTATVKVQPDEPLDKPLVAVTEPEKKAVVEDEAVETKSQPVATTVQPTDVIVETEADEVIETAEPVVTAMAFAAPASSNAIAPIAAVPRQQTLLSVIGTVIFDLYAFATRLVGGPAVVPPGSSVTVRQSTLEIDCGDGYVVPADWYIPATGPEPPTRMIYLQHGFLAAGPWYSYTAATLAEQTNSIVVAPSLTSNFLSCDACWLGAPPMQQAVADLFEADNTALADSLLATGYTGALPQEVVLVGHSLGGGLVAGTAGYMVDNDTIGRLRGVVMLDGVGLDDTMTASLEKVPLEIPIYQLAAPSYFWNQNGVGSAALLEARPDQFVGVVLADGSHVDAMQGGNQLIQFSQQLVAGFSQPQNVEAAEILMVGWVNDMFAGTQEDGIYGDPREEITIDTTAGPATAIALPSSLAKWHLFNLLQPFVPLAGAFFTFEPTCVAESMTVDRCQASMAA